MEPLTIVLATRNKGKLREIRAIYGDLPIVWRSMDDEGDAPVVEETGATFEENALLKARAARDWCRRPAIAEDSGLEVDALSGAPGVRSARFAGENASDEANNQLLLQRLGNARSGDRTARFVSVFALVGADGSEVTAKGACEGRIADGPRGSSGFGYDPLFIPRGEDLTFAELGADFKNRVSHRAAALRALRPLLEERLRRWETRKQ